MKKVRVGIIGVGSIANNQHIPELLKIPECEITAICDTDPKALKTTAEKLGIDSKYCFEDYKELIKCEAVDAVEICTPNYLHVPMAVYAVENGKPINVEKPISINYESAIPLKEALEKNNISNMMCFSYRFFPAVRFAKYIMEKGLLGDIVSVNVEYLKSSAFMEGRRLDWRFVKKYAGTGVLGDLGVHLIDMTEFLVGRIKEVSAVADTVVKQRLKLDCDELADVETDDYCNFLANLDNNAVGTFSITRCAIGNVNTIKYDIYGTQGVISFNLNNPDTISVCIGEIDKKADGLHKLNVPREFKITQEQMFIDMVNNKKCEYLPTVNDGLRCQTILDCLLRSVEEKRWVETNY